MPQHSEQVEAAANAMRKLQVEGNLPWHSRFKFLGFCLSLLPIPVLQQAGMALDRHCADKELDARLDAIWSELLRLDQSIETIKNMEEVIVKIAAAVQSNPGLAKQASSFAGLLAGRDESFQAIAEHGSLQVFTNVMIEAESAYFGSHSNSTTEIEGTHVRSKGGKIVIASKDGGTTRISKSSFRGG